MFQHGRPIAVMQRNTARWELRVLQLPYCIRQPPLCICRAFRGQTFRYMLQSGDFLRLTDRHSVIYGLEADLAAEKR